MSPSVSVEDSELCFELLELLLADDKHSDLARAMIDGALRGLVALVPHEELELSPTETELVELIRRTEVIVGALEIKGMPGT